MALGKSGWAWAAAAAVVLLAGALLSGLIFGGGVRPAIASEDEKRTISVNGSAELEVEPDVAYISFGVFTRADTAGKAQQENARLFASVEKVLKETFGLSGKEIRTTGFYVNPEYRYEPDREPRITGYTARHMVEVTFRDLDKVGALLDAVSKAGVNEVNGVRFDVENVEAHEIAALELALKNARAKAQALAKAENRTIKGVLHISESGGYYVPEYGNADIGFRAMEGAAFSAATPISTGTVKIQKQVSVQYEF